MMRRLEYDAVNIGAEECSGTDSDVQHWLRTSQLPLVSSNVTCDGIEIPKLRMYSRNGRRILVLGVVGHAASSRTGCSVKVAEPVSAAGLILSRYYTPGDLVIILADGLSYGEIVAFADMEDVTCVVGSRLPIPPNCRNVVSIACREASSVALLCFHEAGKARAESVAAAEILLDSSVREDEEIKSYYRRVPGYSYTVDIDGQSVALSYVGSTACGSCHVKAFRTWKQSVHASSLRRLPGGGEELECASCHSTGHYYVTGFIDSGLLNMDLANVGCEACHGPGSLHILEEYHSRNAHGDINLGLPQNPATTCILCHTESSSPLFKYEDYRRKLDICIGDNQIRTDARN